jgi:hypothetical protein
MKKILSLVLLLFVIGSTSAQQDNYTVIRESRVGCLPDGIEFQSQAEVDNFAINYPDCNTILGNVYIDGEDITNLNALININRIEEELTFYMMDFYNFTSSGLDSLHYTGGLLFDWNEPMHLEGLHNLDTVNGHLIVYAGYGNVNLSGLDNLKHISGNLMIEWTSDLSSLNGLEQLHSIGGSLVLGNNDISDISALNNLDTVGGYLSIYGNHSLTSLEALSNVNSSLLTGLNIFGNSNLSVCDVPFICEYLSNPTGPVNIYNNGTGCNNPSEIADSCGFSLSCLPFGHYHLTSQPDVDNFWQDYPGCNILYGGLTIKGEGISNLSGLIGITGINGGVDISYTSLTDLSGLDSLHYITGELQLGWWEGGYNPELVNFNGLGNLESIGGTFMVMYNPSLQSFQGLESLHSVGEFIANGNDILSSFEGLNALDTVNGPFQISGNPVESLAPFENVRYIKGELDITDSPLLTSLTGLDNATISRLIIRSNPMLSECDIKSVCDFLAFPVGYAIINNNSTRCNSREEVEYECTTGLTELAGDHLFLYPNPAKDFLMIKLAENSNVESLTIYSSSGQVVLNQSFSADSPWINISSLPCGLYMVGITGEIEYWGKFMKIE